MHVPQHPTLSLQRALLLFPRTIPKSPSQEYRRWDFPLKCPASQGQNDISKETAREGRVTERERESAFSTVFHITRGAGEGAARNRNAAAAESPAMASARPFDRQAVTRMDPEATQRLSLRTDFRTAPSIGWLLQIDQITMPPSGRCRS